MLRDYSGPAPHTSDLRRQCCCRCRTEGSQPGSADVVQMGSARETVAGGHSANPIWMGCCWWTFAILAAILWLATLLVDIDFTWCRGMPRQITRLGEMSALLPIHAHDWGNTLEYICVPQSAHHLYHLMQNWFSLVTQITVVVSIDDTGSSTCHLYMPFTIPFFCWSIYSLPYERINLMRDQFIYLNHHYSTDDEY